jgi:hypothetical protein
MPENLLGAKRRSWGLGELSLDKSSKGIMSNMTVSAFRLLSGHRIPQMAVSICGKLLSRFQRS